MAQSETQKKREAAPAKLFRLGRALPALGFASLLVSAVGAPDEDPAVTRGRALFDRPFNAAEGLGGPDINGDSCRACNQDPILGGAGPLELNVFRYGRDRGDPNTFIDLPGGQIASKLRAPTFHGRENHHADADVFEQRQPISLFGDGLIETIPDFVIIGNEDPNDANGDGVRGVARRLRIASGIEVGKYGWKAEIATLEDFARDAFWGELGMTTEDDGRNIGRRTDNDPVADPEISSSQVEDLTAFLKSLPAPERGGSTDPRVVDGEQLFHSMGCAVCHVPQLMGRDGPVPLYSNLLLHDVMPADFRGMSEDGAGVGMFRTPPLWGIKDTAPYMHDGRAEDLDQAIRAHFSEGDAARLAYLAATVEAREALILFLEDL